MLTIYSTPVSSNARKVLAALHWLEVGAEIRDIDVYRGEGRTDEYLAINPFGRVPALVDGDFVLFESNAILQYLSEAHGQCRLCSPKPQVRADIARWLFWESAHWQPAWTATITPLAGHRLRPDLFPPPEGEPDWQDAKLVPLLNNLDRHLRQGAWLVGQRLTIADISVAAMMTYARAGHFPFDDYPALARWYARIESLEAWRATSCALWDSAATS